MAESPLSRLGRLLGGVVLMQGKLGHQVLGQMLILGSSEVEMAGVSVALAAASGQQNAVVDAAIRTAAPALAVRAYTRKRERRLERLEDTLAEKEQELAQRDQAVLERESSLQTRQAEMGSRESRVQAEEARVEERQGRMASLEKENRELQADREGLRAHLAVLEQQLKEGRTGGRHRRRRKRRPPPAP